MRIVYAVSVRPDRVPGFLANAQTGPGFAHEYCPFFLYARKDVGRFHRSITGAEVSNDCVTAISVL